MTPADSVRERWRLALRAGDLLAVDPGALRGAIVRAPPSPALDAWLARYRALTADRAPWRRLPAGATAARLVGGLDLAASLSAGKPLFESGLLAACDGGTLVVPMAERLEPDIGAILAAALDDHGVRVERDGFSRQESASFAALLIDESAGEDEAVAMRLSDRVAFAIDLNGLGAGGLGTDVSGLGAIQQARGKLKATLVPDALIEALAATALRCGVISLRALQFAIAAARASAALEGRDKANGEDAALAAALVIAPRAVMAMPEDNQEAAEPPPEDGAGEQDAPQQGQEGPLADQVIAAVKAAIDASILSGAERAGGRARSSGKSGAARKSLLRGRPYGARQGEPSRGGRLQLIDTLRAAAPWQKIRGRTNAADPVCVRRDDLRIARYRRREQSLTIFVVDASGSAAMQRLGETKGAIEELFARSYSRRDEVALIAFRKSAADLLVPPTRSLVRARRLLAELPGGGGTPLAAGIDAALLLAVQAGKRGRTPTIVLMTDGRANVARSGEGGRETAQREALDAARKLRAMGQRVLLFDTAPRPEPLAAALAKELGAAYLPLPYADRRLIAAAVAGKGAAR
ncbi:MAG: magnesium chelatase subunit D [Parvularculaceae bacterium]|nr:magnesium chelatase subunit D [Parvularculaceae bacterium]